jgi:hypothetical protein
MQVAVDLFVVKPPATFFQRNYASSATNRAVENRRGITGVKS